MGNAGYHCKDHGPTILQGVHATHVVMHLRPLVGENLLCGDLVQGLLEQVPHAPQLPLVLFHALDACNGGAAMMEFELY